MPSHQNPVFEELNGKIMASLMAPFTKYPLTQASTIVATSPIANLTDGTPTFSIEKYLEESLSPVVQHLLNQKASQVLGRDVTVAFLFED